MFNIVLVAPLIPSNTGNIARTCACTGSVLHLVKPLGFDISDKALKRAGLDYWDKLEVKVWESFEELQNANKNSPFFFIETTAKNLYTDAKIPKNSFLVFGNEDKGLQNSLIETNEKTALLIPMVGEIRSLNLSNCVALVLYEALRQNNFKGE
ncbi:MAG: tRNA (cytidine(34)-2'-O)-methyltransferase [Firmicutes bacterium]|nr:tRNA (cytidine(34)-2'-O)-methyltransferase [Bacillota bacterium]MCL2256305.1 tRNA (cytidine(34)-2'-O)-methyltransferase [Bacillota bacterium]